MDGYEPVIHSETAPYVAFPSSINDSRVEMALALLPLGMAIVLFLFVYIRNP
jgi:hypothetical protein